MGFIVQRPSLWLKCETSPTDLHSCTEGPQLELEGIQSLLHGGLASRSEPSALQIMSASASGPSSLPPDPSGVRSHLRLPLPQTGMYPFMSPLCHAGLHPLLKL